MKFIEYIFMGNIEEISQKAEEIAKKYNPKQLAPFPFESLNDDFQDVYISVTNESLKDNRSGAILYTPGASEQKSLFSIFINGNKSTEIQNLTVGHELGHYFLHQDFLKDEKESNNIILDSENVLDQNTIVYNESGDKEKIIKIENEANYFALSLLMPYEITKKAWGILKDVEQCASLFQVPVEAMTIRLSRLKLL